MNQIQSRDRKQYIGSTDIASILGINPYRNALDVYNSKTQEVQFESNERMKWGLLLEPVIIKEFCNQRGIKEWNEQVYVQHPIHEFIGGTLDALPIDDSSIIEVKTTSAWNNSFGTTIPDHYMLQCQWLMGLSNRSICHVPVLLGGQELKTYLVEFDSELFVMLINSAVQFWYNHILIQSPPPESEKPTYELTKGNSIDATEQMSKLIEEIRTNRERSNDLDTKTKIAQKMIMDLMGEAEYINQDGRSILQKMKRETESLDKKKALELLGDNAGQCLKRSVSFYTRCL